MMSGCVIAENLARYTLACGSMFGTVFSITSKQMFSPSRSQSSQSTSALHPRASLSSILVTPF